MQEKFRLRCDINTIDLTESVMNSAADALAQYDHVVPYHRYYYLLRGYHDLVHGKIDDERFFTIGDISSEHPVFTGAPKASLESVFLIEEDIAHSTLYVVEQSAYSYYNAKSKDQGVKLEKLLAEKGSKILVI